MSLPPPLPPALPVPSKKKGMNVGCIIGLVIGIGIFIIGILAALAVPAATGVMKRAKQVRTHAAMKDLQMALTSYHIEYNRFPATETESELISDGDLLKALLGAEEQNARKIVFIEPPMARDGKNGLIAIGTAITLVDAWGQPYRIIVDTDSNGSIGNPEKPELTLPEQVIIWSAGEDGNFETWEDNLASWKPYRSTPD